MDSETKDIFRSMIIALDGCTVALEAAAERERRKRADGGLREITHQERLKAVEELIDRATEHLERAG